MQISRTLLNRHFLMSKVSIFEASEALCVKPSETVRQTIDKMRLHHAGSALVSENGKADGIFTERDVITRIALNEPDILKKPISELMTEAPRCVTSSTSVARALHLLAVEGFRNVPLLLENAAPLMITASNVVDYIYITLTKEITQSPDWSPNDDNQVERFLGSPVEILNPSRAITVSPACSVTDAVEQMRNESVGSVIVSQSGKPNGIFTERDYLNNGVNLNSDRNTVPVSELMTKNVVTLQHSLSIAYAYNAMSEGNFRHLPVVNFDDELVGILSIRNFLRSLTDSLVDELAKPQPKPTEDNS